MANERVRGLGEREREREREWYGKRFWRGSEDAPKDGLDARHGDLDLVKPVPLRHHEVLRLEAVPLAHEAVALFEQHVPELVQVLEGLEPQLLGLPRAPFPIEPAERKNAESVLSFER